MGIAVTHAQMMQGVYFQLGGFAVVLVLALIAIYLHSKGDSK